MVRILLIALLTGCSTSIDVDKAYQDTSQELERLYLISSELGDYFVPVYFFLNLMETNDRPHPKRVIIGICDSIYSTYSEWLPSEWNGLPLLYANGDGAGKGGKGAVGCTFTCLEQQPEEGLFSLRVADGFPSASSIDAIVLGRSESGWLQVLEIHRIFP